MVKQESKPQEATPKVQSKPDFKVGALTWASVKGYPRLEQL